MKKQRVPLLKISGDSSIYFDFDENSAYIQHFKGPFTEKAGKNYSFSGTFWLGQSILVGTAILGSVLDSIFEFPVLISIIIAIATGVICAKVFIKVMIVNSLSERDYRELSKKELLRAISNPNRFWVLWLTELGFIVVTSFVVLFLLTQEFISGKEFIMLGLSSFVIISLHDAVHPRLMLKARKILKKQLKEGKFK